MRAQFYDQFRISRPNSYFATASGGLGFAMPAAVGVSLARPDQPVLSIVGDGSAMFGIHALWTAAQHRCPIVYVVMNNGGYSILKAFAEFQRTPGVPGLDLPGLDIVTVAQGLGVNARRVTEAADLPEACRSAFAEALSQRRPVLLDVVVDSTVPKVFG